MPLPHDYVNYTQISWVDSSGVKHRLYPSSKTSNPTNQYQNTNDKLYIQYEIADDGIMIDDHRIFLDGFYQDIFPGMTIEHWAFPEGTIVETVQQGSTSTTADPTETTIYASNKSTHDVGASSVTFHFNGNQAVNQEILGGYFTFTQNNPLYDNRINMANTAYGYSNITDVKIGDRVVCSGLTGAATTTGITSTTLEASKGTPKDTFVTNIATDSYDTYVITLSNFVVNTPSSAQWVNFLRSSDSDTWASYQSSTPSENKNNDYEDDTYWPLDGKRYGLDPQHAQTNGSFYIDEKTGKIHFSSNMSGKAVVVDYISDGLYTEAYEKHDIYHGKEWESLRTYRSPLIHKFAEEAMYKWIAYGIVSGRANIPPVIVQRLKRERFAETRKAKLRLSNIKLEELTQILRGKSKWIKH
jgi:hypothetical protein